MHGLLSVEGFQLRPAHMNQTYLYQMMPMSSYSTQIGRTAAHAIEAPHLTWSKLSPLATALTACTRNDTQSATPLMPEEETTHSIALSLVLRTSIETDIIQFSGTMQAWQSTHATRLVRQVIAEEG